MWYASYCLFLLVKFSVKLTQKCPPNLECQLAPVLLFFWGEW